VGDASIGVGRGATRALKELHWPDSLGLLYSAFTYYTGFKVNSGEYKVMGLAPYGEPKYVRPILDEHLIDLKDDGSFTLNQQYFDYLGGLTMTNAAFDRLFGGPPRKPESRLTQREMDLARSVQVVCEEVMLRMARTSIARPGFRTSAWPAAWR
jgi:carbamoyltransferase